MAARYSDRFFGPQGAPGRDAPTPHDGRDAPGRGPLGSHPAPPDEIDLVGGTAPPPDTEPSYAAAPQRPWHAQALARVALVTALVVGAIGGAYGWDRWRDRELEVVAQSTVDVTAALMLLTFDPESGHTSLSVQLHNRGPHPITVTGFSPLDPRITGDDADFEPADVPPGEDFAEIVNFGLDCSVVLEPSDEVETAVLAHIRTMDGGEHEASFPLLGAELGYGGGVTEQCSYYQPVKSFQDLYPQISSAELIGTDSVTTEIAFSSYSGQVQGEPEIESVEAPSSAFDVTWNGLYADSFDSVTITVRWAVQDCEAALRADDMDMLVNIKGSMPSENGTTTTSAYPSTRLIAQLIRVSELVCR